MACNLPLVLKEELDMPYFLLQSPESPWAGKFDTLVNWQGIYYHPEQHAAADSCQSHNTAVVMWDCHDFTHEYQTQWAGILPVDCLVLAIITESCDHAMLDACTHLHAVVPASMEPAILRQNLQLAEKMLKKQTILSERLRQAEIRIEEMSIIGQAKKWLIANWSFNEEEAHRWLQRQSQAEQQKLINTARKIMQGYYSEQAKTFEEKPE